jgi:two-component system OmpR family response regulator
VPVSRQTAVPKSVLVVEDDPALRKLVNGYMKVLGYAVFEVGDGKKAMSVLAEQRFDLVLLDLMLPESSGYDVLEFMRDRGMGKIPVLMMSARSLPEDRAHAEELGATMYLIKPFSRGDFTKAVKSVMETK